MGMGIIGWLASLLLGFVIGGIFFLSIKAEVEYVVAEKGPTWLMPVALYARMAFVGVVLVMVALLVPREKVAGALLAGLAGAIVARVLVARMVREHLPEEGGEADGPV